MKASIDRGRHVGPVDDDRRAVHDPAVTVGHGSQLRELVQRIVAARPT